MNITVKKFFKNFSYTVLANVLSTIISTLIVFIVPGFIGTLDYGYIQLYLFYVSYTSYLSFGLTDGVYIRYGGRKYDDLPKNLMRTQFSILSVLVLVSSTLIFLGFNIVSNKNPMQTIVLFWACVSGVLVVPRSLITMVLLTTNKMKDYSVIVIIEKIVYFSGVILLIIIGISDFKYYLYSDIIGKVVSCCYAVFCCKDIVFTKIKHNTISLCGAIKECKENISVGIKVVFAGLVGMLIIGVVKYGISERWSVEIFGKVSLTLSISNMLITFINAISLALFPMLCRQSHNRIKEIYLLLESILRFALLGLLVMYYPICIVLGAWLPKYIDSLRYMALLFPICLYESKTLLLLNTNFKALREEKYILITNIVAVFTSIVLSFITIWVMHNLLLSIITITLLLSFRCVFSELVMSKLLQINSIKAILEEIIMSVIFVLASWFVGGGIGELFYIFAYVLYLLINYKKIAEITKKINDILKPQRKSDNDKI